MSENYLMVVSEAKSQNANRRLGDLRWAMTHCRQEFFRASSRRLLQKNTIFCRVSGRDACKSFLGRWLKREGDQKENFNNLLRAVFGFSGRVLQRLTMRPDDKFVPADARGSRAGNGPAPRDADLVRASAFAASLDWLTERVPSTVKAACACGLDCRGSGWEGENRGWSEIIAHNHHAAMGGGRSSASHAGSATAKKCILPKRSQFSSGPF